ncbi:hypothetical protein FOA52_014532 [Chlamydomonas sp. UWO 241]|nr:hypothetical protein FOA52_014532 [Chlamydomonas sp. UWO 241]
MNKQAVSLLLLPSLYLGVLRVSIALLDIVRVGALGSIGALLQLAAGWVLKPRADGSGASDDDSDELVSSTAPAVSDQVSESGAMLPDGLRGALLGDSDGDDLLSMLLDCADGAGNALTSVQIFLEGLLDFFELTDGGALARRIMLCAPLLLILFGRAHTLSAGTGPSASGSGSGSGTAMGHESLALPFLPPWLMLATTGVSVLEVAACVRALQYAWQRRPSPPPVLLLLLLLAARAIVELAVVATSSESLRSTFGGLLGVPGSELPLAGEGSQVAQPALLEQQQGRTQQREQQQQQQQQLGLGLAHDAPMPMPAGTVAPWVTKASASSQSQASQVSQPGGSLDKPPSTADWATPGSQAAAAAAPAEPPTDLTNRSAVAPRGDSRWTRGQPLGAVQLAGDTRRAPPSMGAIGGGTKRKPMFG